MLLFLVVCLASLFLHGFKPALSHYPSPINIFITGYFFPFFALLFAGNYLINKTDLSLGVPCDILFQRLPGNHRLS